MGGGRSRFEPRPNVVGQSRSVLVTALELGYSTSDVNEMFRYNPETFSDDAILTSRWSFLLLYSSPLLLIVPVHQELL